MKEDKLLHPGGERDQKLPGIIAKKSRMPLLFIGALIIFVVLALALGLGLGLGIKHKKTAGGTETPNGTSSNPTNSTIGSPDISFNRPSWRRDPAEYILDMSWDINAAPTTRVFNLTVSEIQAAPDGSLISPESASNMLLTLERGDSVTTRNQWAVSWPSPPSKSKRPSLCQRDKSAIQWNVYALAWILSKRNELDGWNSGNYSMRNSTRNKLPV
jgi:hypothetical protein